MVYKGGCHCGRIAFEVEGDIDQVIDCNCSMCMKRGSLLWFVPRQSLHLSTPEENLGTYHFNTGRIDHHFCDKCGIAPFSEGTHPASGAKMAAVNARCLEGIELSALKVSHVDGRSH
jgi:hypothetical protein